MNNGMLNDGILNNASVVSLERRQSRFLTRLADYLELTKPRIVILELIVAAAAACLAMPRGIEPAVVLHALWGTALIAASASIANQWIERDIDRRMPRTAERPLPAGRVSSFEAIGLATIALIAGLAWLAINVNWLTAALGLASWILYAVVYTPLKTRTTYNTAVGAVAGAIPILMGWTATGAPITLRAVSLVGVLFLWQFPHFMAIAWLYRREYSAAGQRMLTVADPTGVRAGAQAVVGALALIPVSLILAILPPTGSPLVYFAWAVSLGIAQLACAIQFALLRDDDSARRLLRASLLYLPAWLAMLLIVTM